MSLATLEAAIRNIMTSDLLGPELSVIWHAGEPLTVPIAFYADSFRVIDRAISGRTRVTHCIQTNGLLINEDWCELFAEWDVRVGVSIDGPASIHDKHRITRSGRPTHQRVLAGIGQLRKFRLPFHVIAVVTRDSLTHAREIIEFFAEHEVAVVGFNIDEAEGENAVCSLDGLESEYECFLRTALEASRRSPQRLQIREISNAFGIISDGLPQVSLKGQRLPYNAQIIPGAIVCVDTRGDFTTFSPELLGQTHEEYGSFVLGNVATDSIAVALRSQKAIQLEQHILAGVDACRRSCEFFAYCGGGAPVNKLSENGTFASAATVYCRCSIQAPFSVTLSALESELALGRNPATLAGCPQSVR
jgi:uncharacterized protein